MSDEKKPATSEEIKSQQEAAANLVRTKLNKLYAGEPDALEEIEEVEELSKAQMSKHQRYMKELTDSKRGLAEIQTAWHEYYTNLADDEKHEVWKEFYAEHERAKTADSPAAPQPKVIEHKPVYETARKASAPAKPLYGHTYSSRKPRTSRLSQISRADVKQQLISTVQKRTKRASSAKHHIHSLLFGLGVGGLTVLILLFSFFNERFITPFIRPSNNVSASPIIVDPTSTESIGAEPKIIIPKINVEAPVVYDEPSIAELALEHALERGVVHYPTTPNPGEKGNAVIFGHSSSNILNKGKFKFAFILLKSLDEGDTFIIQKDGKRFVYKVYKKFVTSPTDTSVLGPADRQSTMTLITCDPPGTSTRRLIVIGEQIFPDPNANLESTAPPATVAPTKLPSNAPSLWQRIKNVF